MCGIFAYVGAERDAGSLVFQGLKELEYRGYDSWGIAIAHNGGAIYSKEVGKLPANGPSLPRTQAALGHTRWATTGGVTKRNAHPHLDATGRFAVVHNGIVENYTELRSSLESEGYCFNSETDTEVLAALIAREMAAPDSSLSESLLTVFRRLSGLNAVVVMDTRTLEIAAAKSGSPLYIGIGSEGRFLASDVSAFLAHTDRMIRLDDGQLASINGMTVKLVDVKGSNELPVFSEKIHWKRGSAELGRFSHYLEKEIHEQPGIVRSILSEEPPAREEIRAMLGTAKRVWLAGCGTAYHAALAGTYLLQRSVAAPVSAIHAHELEYFVDKFTTDDLLIVMSQSGETIDVLETAKTAKRQGARVAAFVNVPGSSLTHIADASLLLGAGPEKSVLSTKAYTAKLANLVALPMTWSEHSRAALARAATEMECLLGDSMRMKIADLATKIASARSMFLLGAGLNYPLALEAALKIKEVSYIHAEGFACGELKHGVIALIEPGTPCMVFDSGGVEGERALVSAGQIRARGALVIGVSAANNPVFDIHIPVRRTGTEFSLAAVVPAQLLAYELALRLQRDPDKPRNLAKSVTVR